MCWWHVHMQITCEQCPDATCRENHQHRLCRKSFTWSWNETSQHCCDKFHSITSSCHSRKIVQVHADHEEFCRWCADDICACRQCADDIHACRWRADNIPTCGWCSGRHMSSASRNLQWSLTLVSSAHCPCVICMSSAHRLHETSVPRLFQVKQQRTALLKTQVKYKILWDLVMFSLKWYLLAVLNRCKSFF